MSVEEVLLPREKDLGGFTVRRVLPTKKRKMVGPFIFWDHMGPADVIHGNEITVRPHPHIHLATITYLFSGGIFHRDSLGNAQEIRPGEVNWMRAGKGIVHSERTAPIKDLIGGTIEGIQSWVALPVDQEESEPGFYHFSQEALPFIESSGCHLHLIAGKALGKESPVPVSSPMFYLDGKLDAGASLHFPMDSKHEGAVYLVRGELRVNGERLEPYHMKIMALGEEIRLEAKEEARVMILGGEPFGEERFIWWNFVSSSREKIEKAKHDWKSGVFPIVPGDENEWIPLPV